MIPQFHHLHHPFAQLAVTSSMDARDVRQQLADALRGGMAYDTFEDILSEIPESGRFAVPPGAERSPWQIVEHMRLTLEDLIEYSDNYDGHYRERAWPDEYWPSPAAPTSPKAWDEAVAGFLEARSRMEAMIQDPERDLTAPFPWNERHTLLRETLLAIDHNGYHSGQLIELTRWMG